MVDRFLVEIALFAICLLVIFYVFESMHIEEVILKWLGGDMELEECPFCGNTNPIVEYTQMDNDMWLCMMTCTNDAPAIVLSVQGVGDTEEEAYKMACNFWNTRHERTCKFIEVGDDYEEIYEQVYKCSNCGVENIGAAAFCPNCGARVIDE